MVHIIILIVLANYVSWEHDQLESWTDIYGYIYAYMLGTGEDYKHARHQIFQDAAKETLNATYQHDSKVVLF